MTKVLSFYRDTGLDMAHHDWRGYVEDGEPDDHSYFDYLYVPKSDPLSRKDILKVTIEAEE